MKKHFLKILILAFLLIGCDNSENYSIAPEIKFMDFTLTEGDPGYSTSVGILKFSFVDGDGDIGFGENKDTLHQQEYDIFIIEYILKNEVSIYRDTLNYWMPYFEEGIYRKSIKGEIEIKLQRTIESPDTVKYEFYILDRAMNKSNIETTPTIIYSELLKQ